MVDPDTNRMLVRSGRMVLVALILLLLGPRFSTAFELEGVPLSSKPKIDGILDDSVWSEAAVADGFVQFVPQFGQPSPYRTVVLVGYTEDALYVAF